MSEETAAKTENTNAAPKMGLDVDKIIDSAKDKPAGEGENKAVTTDDPNKPAEGKDVKAQPGEPAERPEYVPEKFWDAEKGEPRLEAMSKAFSDMEKQFRKGDHKAPEKPEGYKVALDDDQKTLLFGDKDADPHQDPLFQKLTVWGVKAGISQAHFNELLGMYAEATGEEAGKFQIDVTAERQKLGKNVDLILENQNQFFQQLFKTGVIGEAELKEAGILSETAAGVKLIQALRAHLGGEKSIPVDGPATEPEGMPSKEELGRMQADPKYGTDATYTAKVDKLYEQKYGTAPAMSSRR